MRTAPSRARGAFLNRLLRPRSVAIVGASATPGSLGKLRTWPRTGWFGGAGCQSQAGGDSRPPVPPLDQRTSRTVWVCRARYPSRRRLPTLAACATRRGA